MTPAKKNPTQPFPVPVPTADQETHDLLTEIQEILSALELAQRQRNAIPRPCPKCGWPEHTPHIIHAEATP